MRGKPFQKGNKPWNASAAMKGNAHAVKHSLHVYRRMLSGKLDGRMSLAKVLREKEQELITALGGDPSPQQRILITDVVNGQLFKGTIEKYLVSIDGKIVRGTKVIPVVDTWIAVSKHVRTTLQALGLERQTKKASLKDLLAEPSAEQTDSGSTDDENDRVND